MSETHKKPAAENPWYVLATLAGEQTEDYDHKLTEKTRAYWNAWASHAMTKEKKAAIKDGGGRSILDDAPEWASVKTGIMKLFEKRLPNTELPDPSTEVDFRDVEFSNPIGFNRFFFSGDASFASATFTGDAYFRNATFTGPSKFIKTKFDKRASFTDAVFDALCNLRDAKFISAYPDLEGTLLHSKTNVTAEDEHWPPAGIAQSDKEALNSCAHLRQNMASQGLNEAAHFFFRREMTHKAKLSKWWERPFYAIYRFAEYGYGVWQPLAGIVALWLVGALSLFHWGCLPYTTALGLSFANIFKFFGFQRVYFAGDVIGKLNLSLEIMTGAQTVIGYFLLFLLGLGLRNRFRLK
jgi:hypothetical protein